MKRYSVALLGLLSLLLACTPTPSEPNLGPSPYLSKEDSPFVPSEFAGGFFHLEDFEDGTLSTPGVSSNGIAAKASFPTLVDSVDGDDGSRDGKCPGCDSWFSSSGVQGITFTFDEAGLGGTLPTHVGIVWTDAGFEAAITFEAFNATGQKITTKGGVVADDSNSDTPAEDRFFGVIAPNGVKQISVLASSGGIEVDHLHYGRK